MRHLSFTLRFSIVAASIGLSSLGLAALLGSFSRVDAHDLGPEVTGGTHPYVSFTGTAPVGVFTTIYTVPNDRILVVTGATLSGSDGSLYQGATPKVLSASGAMSEFAQSAALASGNSHVVFDPGSTVVIRPDTVPVAYFIQGYLAHP